MLIRRAQLDGIVRGDVTLAFRSWLRPTVRAGGTLHTSVGLLEIEAVDPVKETALTSAAARQAGFASAEELRASLRLEADRTIYRIRLRFRGADPRVALRNDARLTADDRAELLDRLARYDGASRRGPWTSVTLRAIRERPATLAGTLAAELGFERAWFKTNVRKLKALGLTESLEVGYRLSPRGEALLGVGTPRKKA